jgi:hypothetical protein
MPSMLRLAEGRALVVALLLLGGCAANDSKREPATYDPAVHARIRTFNVNGAAIVFYPGKTCTSRDDALSVSHGGYSMLRANRTLGMPVPSDTPRAYHENIVVGAQPLTIASSFELPGAVKVTCNPFSVSFTPEAGKDYDAHLAFSNNRCGIEIREITVTEQKVETKSVRSQFASRCSDLQPH